MATPHALTVHPDQQRALEAIASAQHRSPEELVHDAIEFYLSMQSQQAELAGHFPLENEEAELQRAEESWQHYQQTGLHLTQQEVSSWIDRLEKDPDAKLPPCHT